MQTLVTEAAAAVEAARLTEEGDTLAAGLGHTLAPDILARGTGTFIDRTLAARCRPEGGTLATGIILVPRAASGYSDYLSTPQSNRFTISSPNTVP